VKMINFDVFNGKTILIQVIFIVDKATSDINCS